MTPKELAQEFETDPRTIRKFLRSLTTDRAGKGGRWTIDPSDLDALRDRFDAFNARRTTTFSLTDED